MSDVGKNSIESMSMKTACNVRSGGSSAPKAAVAFFLDVYRCWNRGKNTRKAIPWTSLNFRIYVKVFDPAFCQLESTLSLFRNNNPVPFLLFREGIAQWSQTRPLSPTQFWMCRWAV